MTRPRSQPGMPRTEPPAVTGRSGILISADALFEAVSGEPRALADAPAAIERLGWIGRPVVLVGEELADRRLPVEPEDRLSWVRAHLELPGLDIVAFDEAGSGRLGEAADRQAAEQWDWLRDEWQAERLITVHELSVGPARRAGLTVVRIGPRGSSPGASVERADHEARDLLDAVSHLITMDTFGAGVPR